VRQLPSKAARRNQAIFQSTDQEAQQFQDEERLPEAVRGKVVELLNARPADCIDLQTQTKQAHWNVKRPEFIALHELFDASSTTCALVGSALSGVSGGTV
jgi:DNA-binding ferritin-like protein